MSNFINFNTDDDKARGKYDNIVSTEVCNKGVIVASNKKVLVCVFIGCGGCKHGQTHKRHFARGSVSHLSLWPKLSRRAK